MTGEENEMNGQNAGEGPIPPEDPEAPEPTPQLIITWDAARQAVDLHFNPQQFQNWDFICGVIEIAKDKAEFARTAAKMQSLQQAQAQAIREQQIVQQLRGQRPRSERS